MTANTARGYPYPQLTDTVDQLAAYFQNLATAIDADVASVDSRPRARLVAQATQSIAHNTATALQFGASSETLDASNWHDTVTNNTRLTPTIQGWYEVWGAVALGNRTDYITMYSWIRQNGSTAIPPATKPPLPSVQIASTNMLPVTPVTVFMNGSTDYLELMTQHTNGAAVAQLTALSFQFASTFELKLAYPT
jgi:hypothetical protein